MSEYQYYEFAAVERALTSEELAALRRASSRAAITPRGFVNHYDWGGLKADPSDWMRRYFDAFVWTSDGGACELMLRVPEGVLDRAEVKRYCTASAFTRADSKDHTVLRWSLDETEDYERFVEDDGRGWMGRLLPLRDELLRGDRRPLYLGWLAGVTAGDVADRALEPERPNGLAQLTAAQQALAEFLEVDVDLLAAVTGDAPPGRCPTSHEACDANAWLGQRTVAELRGTVALLLQGQAQLAEREARLGFLAWQKRTAPALVPVAPPRTVAELRAKAEVAGRAQLQREAEARAQQQSKERQRRERQLRALAADAKQAWNNIEKLAVRGTGHDYDAATRALAELSEASTLLACRTEFQHALRRFVIRHDRRKALLQRLVKAGLLRQ